MDSTAQQRPPYAAQALSDSTPMIIRQASAPEHYDIAKILFQEYAAAIKIDLCFQGFAHELTVLDRMYAPPDGCLLIAFLGDTPAGCVALRKLDTGVGELKRMYVRPECRGHGIGITLARTLLSIAQEIGYRIIRLDTMESMVEARAIYTRLGFSPCNPYYANPIPNVIYMEKVLNGSIA